MVVSLRFEGVITNPFALINQGDLIRGLMDVQARWADRLRAIFITYPATRPGQTYIRTFEFRDNWQIIPPRYAGSAIETSIVNDTDYAIHVIGNDLGNLQNQAYHAGRWYLLRDVTRDSQDQLRREAQEVINRVLAPARMTP